MGKRKLSSLQARRGYWQIVTLADGVELHLLYVKGTETRLNCSLEYRVMLYRVVLKVGMLIVNDYTLAEGGYFLWTRDCEVTPV